ncbi:hypothetical protein FKR81_33765 [Lentzea tibetensis]|uniref:Tachylectin n=1 Tax=Lentzea tibetensis TaxID=2591470 RepID=A0A563EJH4_9PSEU|nr:hypothetical protein [Lentzea tibetensis]TWP47019.1 hypothetical protein FKR81_33765 [Lentzea tibetensis]
MSATVVTPALADPPPDPCALWERQVYAITTAGGLVEHRFCLETNRDASRWAGEQVVAREGWADVAAVFWSGVRHGTGVYYRVSATTGGLYWSADLLSWQQVGASDWRGFTSLISTEPGVIYGTDKAGAVHRWVHSGWQDGADTWDGERIVALSGASRLIGDTREGIIGLTGDGTVTAWTATGRVVGRTKLRITVPDIVAPEQIVAFDLSPKYPTSAFAITTTGRLAVLMPTSCESNNRVWRVDEEKGSGYRKVFTGGYVANGQGPVEWQCVAPGPGPQ